MCQVFHLSEFMKSLQWIHAGCHCRHSTAEAKKTQKGCFSLGPPGLSLLSRNGWTSSSPLSLPRLLGSEYTRPCSLGPPSPMLAVSPALFLTSRPIFQGPRASSVHRGGKAIGAPKTGAQPGTSPCFLKLLLCCHSMWLLEMTVPTPGRALCS